MKLDFGPDTHLGLDREGDANAFDPPHDRISNTAAIVGRCRLVEATAGVSNENVDA